MRPLLEHSKNERNGSLTKKVLEPQSPFGSRLDVIVLVILLVATFFTWLPRSQGEIDFRLDAGVYYVLGMSLAEGHGYRLSNEPGEIHANQYPPFVPAIIAVQQKLGRTTDSFLIGRHLKLFWFFLLLLFAGLTYSLLRSSFSIALSCFGVVFCLLNTQLCFYSNQATGELPFAVISLLFVLLYRKRQGEALASVLAVAAFFCRTIGVALFAAWIADAILRQQLLRAAVRSTIALTCVLVWGAYIHSVETSVEYKRPTYSYQRAAYLFYNVSYVKNTAYKDPFRPELGMASFKDRTERFLMNLLAVPSGVGEATTSYKGFWESEAGKLNHMLGLTVFSPAMVSAIIITVGCCVLAGVGILLWRREWFISLYILFTILIACCAPWQQISRYLIPITALLVFSLFTFLQSVSRIAGFNSQERRIIWVRRSICAVLVLGACEQAASYFLAHFRFSGPQSYLEATGKVVSFRQFLYQTQDIDLEEAVTWIKRHARHGDIVAASMPQWIYLETGLKTVMPPLEPDPAKAKVLLESIPVRYLIVENRSRMGDSVRDNVLPVVQKFATDWPRVYVTKDGNVRVFENASGGLNGGAK